MNGDCFHDAFVSPGADALRALRKRARPDELIAMLEDFEFHPTVSVSQGEFAVRLPELGLIAGGSSFDEALEELVELAEAYAADYVRRLEFLKETDRRRQLPWVVRIAFTAPDARRSLFMQGR